MKPKVGAGAPPGAEAQPAGFVPAKGAAAGQVWVLGASGMLGQATCAVLRARGFAVVESGSEVDVADAAATASFARRHPCATWINCAAMTAVDACEDGGVGAARNEAANARGPAVLAAAARADGVRVLHVSTDYVFAGDAAAPYAEDAACAPKSAYGRAKLAGERGFWQALGPAAAELGYVVRTAWLFGPHGKNFVTTMLALMGTRPQLQVVNDQHGRPTYTVDLAAAMLDLLGLCGNKATLPVAKADAPPPAAPAPAPAPPPRAGEPGTYHFANAGQTSWHGFAEGILAEARRCALPLACQHVVATNSAQFVRPAPRPAYSVLGTAKIERALGREARPWTEALQAYFTELAPGPTAGDGASGRD